MEQHKRLKNELYEVSNKVLSDDKLKEALRNLFQETDKYGEQKDFVLTILLGQIANHFDKIDFFISCTEAIKLVSLLNTINELQPMLELARKLQEQP